jgi:DNA-binding beta-propeller fold protein YncE
VAGNIAADSVNAYALDRENRQVDTIDSSSRQIVKRRRLPGVPTDLVVTDDHHLWVGTTNNRVVDINLENDKQVVARTAITPNYLVVLSHEVVVMANPDSGGSLQRVDIATHRAIGKPKRIGGAPTDLVGSAGEFWVLMAFPPEVLQFGARLNKLAEKRLTSGGLPPEMTDDGENLWISQFDTGQVVRFDEFDGKQIPPVIHVGRHPNGISYDVDTRSVWVANTGDETVTRMDEKTAKVTARVSTKGPIEGQLAASGGVAWAAGTNDVVRIQPVGSD